MKQRRATSKHLKLSKIEKQEAAKIIMKSNKNISIIFPKIVFPQYWDDSDQKFIEINNEQELDQAVQRQEKLKYGGQLLITKESKEGKKIKDSIDKVWNYYKLDAIKGSNRVANYPLEDGDIKAEELEADDKNGDAYKGMWIMKISSSFNFKRRATGSRRFKCFNRTDDSGKWLPETDLDVNGWFVSIGLRVDFYDYGSNIGLKVYLNNIQFLEQNPDLDFGNNDDDSDEFDFDSVIDAEEGKDNQKNEAVNDDGVPLTDGDDDDVFN